MRVILDSNILISYLLAPHRDGCIRDIVHAAIMQRYDLVLPTDLLAEMMEVTSRATYLANRISPAEVKALLHLLSQVAVHVPRFMEQPPAVTRDRKDDYLLACAMVGQADYLVTGDKDLLVIQQVGDLHIVSAHEFLAILRDAAATP